MTTNRRQQRSPLLTLPPELLLSIAESLPLPSLSRLSRTNVRLSSLLTPLVNASATQAVQVAGLPLLHWAVLRNDARLVRVLLANGVEDVAWKGYCGFTALHLAVAHGGPEVVGVLIKGENGGGVRGVRVYCGRTPGGIARMRGGFEGVLGLLGE